MKNYVQQFGSTCLVAILTLAATEDENDSVTGEILRKKKVISTPMVRPLRTTKVRMRG